LDKGTISASAEAVRRLVVTKQHLAGPLPSKPTREDILTTIRDLAYVQWDPVSIVAPSHIISLWCRIGDFPLSDLDALLWDEKKLFEHWTPMASIVLTEDYPIYSSLMKRYPDSLTSSWGSLRVRAKEFLSRHEELRKSMLRQLKKGPLQSSQFREYVRTQRSDDGWTPGSDVSRMLFHLHMSGQAMVVGHEGNQNVWGLSEKFLPRWVDKLPLSGVEFERQAAQRALRALGAATPREILFYYVRGRYQGLKETLAQLEEERRVHRVTVAEFGERDERYIHEDDLPLLESMNDAAWEPRMSFLPPFDNMLAGKDRVWKLFGFDYVREQFLPQEKRRYGTYVLPIVWGSRIIGRLDPALDRKNRKLVVNAVHADHGAPADEAVAFEVRRTIERFASFLGADGIVLPSHVPAAWRTALR
jgi:uncharacterized protein YcaQ